MNIYSSFEEYIASLEGQVKRSLEKIKDTLESHPTQEGEWLSSIDAYFKDNSTVPKAEDIIVHPPKLNSEGVQPDYSLPVFIFAKALEKSPVEVASLVAESLDGLSQFEWAKSIGPYVNIRISDKLLIDNVKKIIHEPKSFFAINHNAGKVAIVEYSSPNVAKPFGISHLRSTVIGETLARFLQATGYSVVRDNHLGDWGTQFGNLLAAHQEYAPERPFSSLSMEELTTFYVKFSQEKKESPQLTKLGRKMFAQLESANPELLGRWLYALALSLQDFEEMYKRLNVHFDTLLGESFYTQRSNTLIEKLRTLSLNDLIVFDDETRAVYINSEHPVVIRTQDGYGVYAARDLATIEFRRDVYSPDLVLYVVGDEQESYFKAVFDAADKSELTRRDEKSPMRIEHVQFGLLLDKFGKKLSTRKGTSGRLDDVIEALYDRALIETKSRSPDMTDEQAMSIAQKISTGALIWNDLRTDRTSSVRFDIDSMLQLGGGSVIDILYSYTRTCSLLSKVENTPFNNDDSPSVFSTEAEHQLVVLMSEFNRMVEKTVATRSPHLFVAYMQELTQIHGRFYEASRVNGLEDEPLMQLRIMIHQAYKQIVEQGLDLLNIPVVDRL